MPEAALRWVCCVQTADADVLEKAVDCLRILTTSNDSNKVALFTIPAGVPALVRLLSTTNPDQVRRPAASLCQGSGMGHRPSQAVHAQNFLSAL